jgi:hypothetical protein
MFLPAMHPGVRKRSQGQTPATRASGGSDAQAERSTPRTSLCAEGAAG